MLITLFLFNVTTNMYIMEKYAVTIDWLQTFGYADVIKEGVYGSRNYIFVIRLKNIQTQLFKNVYQVMCKDREVATILQVPRSSVLNIKSTAIKLHNRVLYCEKYIDILYNLFEAINYEYKGITRLDLALDCNFLSEGRSVEGFIRQYVTESQGSDKHIIRRGNDRFELFAVNDKKTKCKMNGIKWGSPHSKMRAYCYNKTLELIEVKDKPWIRKFWEENGLISEVDEKALDELSSRKKRYETEYRSLARYIQTPVWRFEISIKAESTDLLNMSTGELFRLSPLYLEHRDKIAQLFFIYAEKVFHFRISNGKRAIRNYDRYTLWDAQESQTVKPVNMSRYADTGRSEKTCYNKLMKLSEEYSDMSDSLRGSISEAMKFLLNLSGVKSRIFKLHDTLHALDSLRGRKFIDHETHLYFSLIKAVGDAHMSLSEINAMYRFAVEFTELSPIDVEVITACPPPKPDELSIVW